MKQRLVSAFLILTLLVPEMLLARTATRQVASAGAPPAAAPSAQSSGEGPTTVRPQASTQRRRSYERETRARRHSGISKKEVAFMAAIAGTSMGIGAIAGGGTGLAIGAIVGGWSAYAAHRLWRWIR